MTETERDVQKPGDTPKREDRVTLRFDPDKWKAFDTAAKTLKYRSRNAYLDDFMDWVLHKPGAKIPKRPPAPEPAPDI